MFKLGDRVKDLSSANFGLGTIISFSSYKSEVTGINVRFDSQEHKYTDITDCHNRNFDNIELVDLLTKLEREKQ